MTDRTIAIGQKSAVRVLKGIVRRHAGRLSLTGGLVIAEKALDLFYPIATGIVIDAVLSGDLQRTFLMIGIILRFGCRCGPKGRRHPRLC